MKAKVKNFAIGMVVLAGSSVAFAVSWYGSSAAAWEALRGRSLHVVRPLISFGVVEAETRFPVTFEIRNLTNEPIRLLGAAASCGCLVPQHLPMTIPPFTTARLEVVVRPSKPNEDFLQKVRVYTNVPDEPLLELAIVGIFRSKVVEETAGNQGLPVY